MIYVDDREGSRDLARLLHEETALVKLEFADVYFEGNGPKGKINIGIERKTVTDLINSITTGRLSGYQIPGLMHCYHKVYVIVEGLFRENSGTIEIYRGKWYPLKTKKFTHQGLWSYLADLEDIGIIVRRTTSVHDTALQIEYLYRHWSKPWEGHKGLKQIYRPSPPVSLAPLSKYERAFMGLASDLPHIGYDRVKAVMKHFKSIDKMIEATEKEWREVEGIGRITAKEVWNLLHKEE